MYITVEQLRTRLTSDASFEQAQNSSPAYEVFLDEAAASAEAVVNAYVGEGQPFAFTTEGTSGAPASRIFTGDGTATLYLDQPLQELVSLTNDGEAVATADVWLEPANAAIKTQVILKTGYWSATRQAVTVSGVWGWGTPPAEVVEATLELAVRIVKGRAAGYSDIVGVGPDGTAQYVKALPPLVKTALDLARTRYRMPRGNALGWIVA